MLKWLFGGALVTLFSVTLIALQISIGDVDLQLKIKSPRPSGSAKEAAVPPAPAPERSQGAKLHTSEAEAEMACGKNNVMPWQDVTNPYGKPRIAGWSCLNPAKAQNPPSPSDAGSELQAFLSDLCAPKAWVGWHFEDGRLAPTCG